LLVISFQTFLLWNTKEDIFLEKGVCSYYKGQWGPKQQWSPLTFIMLTEKY